MVGQGLPPEHHVRSPLPSAIAAEAKLSATPAADVFIVISVSQVSGGRLAQGRARIGGRLPSQSEPA